MPSFIYLFSFDARKKAKIREQKDESAGETTAEREDPSGLDSTITIYRHPRRKAAIGGVVSRQRFAKKFKIGQRRVVVWRARNKACGLSGRPGKGRCRIVESLEIAEESVRDGGQLENEISIDVCSGERGARRNRADKIP